MSTMPDLHDFHALTAATAAATQKLRDALDAIRAELGAAERARAAASTGDAPKQEQLANLERLLAEARSRWTVSNAGRLRRDLSGGFTIRGDSFGREVRTRLRPRLPRPESDRERDELLALVAAEVVYRGAVEATAAVEGVPDAEREARIADLDRTIAALEVREEEVIRHARAVGVPLPRRPAAQEALERQIHELQGRRDKLRGELRTADADAANPGMRRDWREGRADQGAALRERLRPIDAELAELRGVL